MIPRQLLIKNFLSYGPETQTIDFSNYHLICLSGKNGHGKSAMLDAITWAIWGQARKSSGTTKPDAGLLHLGQKHMMVILEFEVGGQQYRVRREYLNTASKPFATLDFGIKNADGTLIALTDKTIKDTQEKIERTIGITYESFTNSTFLRQGQSNEFSKKSPKERKEILAQILQLQKFEEQKRIALMHARKLQQDYITQSKIQQRIEQELIELSCVAEQYIITQKNLENIQTQHNIFKQEQSNIAQQDQIVQQRRNEQKFLLIQKENSTKTLTHAQQELLDLEKSIHQEHTLVDIEKLNQEEQKLHTLVQQLQTNQQKKLLLKEQYFTTKEKLTELTNQVQEQYQKDTQELQVQTAKHQEAMLYLDKQLEQEHLAYNSLQTELKIVEQEINKLSKQITQMQAMQDQYQQAEDLFEKNKQHYQNVCAQGTYLKQQILHLQKNTADSQNNQEICLQCEQTINSDQQELIHKKLRVAEEQAQLQMIQLKAEAQDLKTKLAEQHSKVQHLKQSCETFIQLSTYAQEQHKHYDKIIKQSEIAEQKLKKLSAEKILLEQQLQTISTGQQTAKNKLNQALQHSSLQELKKLLENIENEAKQIVYQPQEHQLAEQKLTEIRNILHHHKNSTDSSAQTEQKSKLLQLQTTIKTMQQQIADLTTQLAAFIHLEQQEHTLKQEQNKLEQNIAQLEIQHRSLLIEKGSLENKQKKRIDLENELSSITCTIKTLFQEMTDYQEISKALGKDGIQALLIEQAIPEIEHETNQILARLTNNQTQIFIESLRDLKKGGSRETLDIKISDSFGLRDYEMFSGGEAFRIDFALRIGISKLLARRAGTTLQTIFIDEGFGSQDEEGLQLIMDNIYKIQDEFAKIIIVSHLPEMKEQFPVQFIIEKKRSGSTVSIVHQG